MLKFIILPVIGAIIGWVTNLVAIKLIFRPINPVVMPIIKYKIHGIIPKRQDNIAESIGSIVEKNLLTNEDIVGSILEPANKKAIVSKIKTEAIKSVSQKIPNMTPMYLKSLVITYIEDILEKELHLMIERVAFSVMNDEKMQVGIKKIVEDKIKNFELAQLESLIIEVASKELRHLEILGGILGFIIGIIQALILYLFNA